MLYIVANPPVRLIFSAKYAILSANETDGGARYPRTWWGKTHVQDLKRAAADLRRIQPVLRDEAQSEGRVCPSRRHVGVDESGHARLEHVDSMDAPDGVSTCHLLEIEDEAA